MVKKDQQSRRREEAELLNRITDSLSDSEIERLVACSLLALDGAGLDRLIKRLGRGTGETLQKLLEAHRAGPDQPLPPAGSPKISQEWQNAWSEWWNCIDEASREEGRYIIYENHWEPSYLDPYSLADDLDRIAVRMKEILDRVIDENLDPDLSFAEAIRESTKTITRGLPEWMAPAETEGYPIGPEVTDCLLTWEWRTAIRDGMSAFDFTNSIHNLESSSTGLYLDGNTVINFFSDLDEQAQKTIFRELVSQEGSDDWAEFLSRTTSHWFRIYQNLCKRWDRSRYLASCRENIKHDWRLAVPLVEELVQKKAFSEAISIIEQGVRVLLFRGQDKIWDPRATLFTSHRGVMYHGARESEVTELLQYWQKAATALNANDLACALQLQETLYLKWEDWDAILAAFENVSEPEFAAIKNTLFNEWRALVADESVGTYRRDDDEQPLTWVHSLVDAATAGNAGPALFRDALRDWLNEIGRSPIKLKENLVPLKTLTTDLDTGEELRKLSPTLHDLITPDFESLPPLTASRRQWLQKMNALKLFPEVSEFWKRSIAELVPDPAGAKRSRYHNHVKWLSAVLELNPTAYEEVIHEWADVHRRRRNLWTAIAERGLPVKRDS